MNKLTLASSLTSIALVGTLGLASSAALADSIAPETYTANLGIGESVRSEEAHV